MTTTPEDDDWAELARELGEQVQKNPGGPPPAADPFEGFAADPTGPDDGPDDPAEAVEAEAVPAEGGPGEDAGVGEGQPGTGRKRRRRRRRKKGGPTDPPAAGPDEEEAAADADPPEAEPAEAEDVEAFAGGDPEDAEEVGGELLRDLIANWNVPSWDEIVSGLHRPER
jgi:hypothetical protein